ncbi:MAG: hypothetical protein ACRETG_09615 [Steroidobacteraceae bacterium]
MAAPTTPSRAHDVSVCQPLEWLRRGWDDVKHTGSPDLARGAALIAILGAVLLMLGSPRGSLARYFW